MPLYEYRCQQCHRHTEKRQKFSDPEITECPHCGGHLERVISAPNIAFKGGGWYKDLYSSPKPAEAGDGKAESKADGKADASSAATESSSKPPAGSNDGSSAPPSSPPAAAAAASPATAASPASWKS